MIDTSFVKGSCGNVVDYYVVEGSIGRFYSLDIAKEIAEHRARKGKQK